MTAAPSFSTVLNNSIEEKSLTATNPNKLKSSLKLNTWEDEVNQMSELEDKYCSFCGSMIDDEGNCPICTVPIFIHGKQNQNGNITQADSLHSKSASEMTVVSGKRGIPKNRVNK